MGSLRDSDAARAFFRAKASSWSCNYDTGGGMGDRIAIFAAALSSRLPPGGAILDFGCGSGEIARHLGGQGWRVTACDITPEMIATARARDEAGRVRWLLLEHGALPFSTPQFDGIIASSVLEYSDDPGAMIAALTGALNPGGVVIISVPDPRDPLRRRESWRRAVLRVPGVAGLLRRTRWAEGATYLKISRNRFALPRWADLLAQAGLAVELPAPYRGPLVNIVGRKPLAGAQPGIPLPTEDIFGNTKKLKFILTEIATHRARLGRDIVVLDFGCGNAEALGRYLIGPGLRYVGVDFHAPSLAHARDRFAAPNAQFLAAVPPGITFDAIVYADVLEHLDDPLAALAAHVRQLAPDGIVVGSVPNGYGACETEKFIDRHLRLYQMLRWVKRTALREAGRLPNLPPPIPYNSESGHVVFFTLRSLRQMVDAAGLRLARFGHGGFVGADLTGSTIFAGRRFVDWNVRIADRLPNWAVSTWYFVLAKS